MGCSSRRAQGFLPLSNPVEYDRIYSIEHRSNGGGWGYALRKEVSLCQLP